MEKLILILLVSLSIVNAKEPCEYASGQKFSNFQEVVYLQQKLKDPEYSGKSGFMNREKLIYLLREYVAKECGCSNQFIEEAKEVISENIVTAEGLVEADGRRENYMTRLFPDEGRQENREFWMQYGKDLDRLNQVSSKSCHTNYRYMWNGYIKLEKRRYQKTLSYLDKLDKYWQDKKVPYDRNSSLKDLIFNTTYVNTIERQIPKGKGHLFIQGSYEGEDASGIDINKPFVVFTMAYNPTSPETILSTTFQSEMDHSYLITDIKADGTNYGFTLNTYNGKLAWKMDNYAMSNMVFRLRTDMGKMYFSFPYVSKEQVLAIYCPDTTSCLDYFKDGRDFLDFLSEQGFEARYKIPEYNQWSQDINRLEGHYYNTYILYGDFDFFKEITDGN